MVGAVGGGTFGGLLLGARAGDGGAAWAAVAVSLTPCDAWLSSLLPLPRVGRPVLPLLPSRDTISISICMTGLGVSTPCPPFERPRRLRLLRCEPSPSPSSNDLVLGVSASEDVALSARARRQQEQHNPNRSLRSSTHSWM